MTRHSGCTPPALRATARAWACWRRLLGLGCLCLVACGESGREAVVPPPPLAATPGAPKAGSAPPATAETQESTLPSREAIIDAWQKNSGEEVEVVELQAVRLLSRERAYLAGVIFTGRSGAARSGALLVTPDLQTLTEIRGDIGPRFRVLDLDGDGVSEIVSSRTGAGDKTIAQLQDATAVVLHRAAAPQDSRPAETGEGEHSSTQVDWQFTKVDEQPVLREQIVTRTRTCASGGACEEKTTQQTQTYRYVQRQFLKLDTPPPPASGTPP